MKTILLILLMMIAVILTAWLLVIPGGVLVGSYKALRHGEWRGGRYGKPH